MTELHCAITGRVQGVAYRQFVQSIARELSITGYVTNMPDGSVEVLAQGEYGVLKVFLRHLGTGPVGSQVQQVYEEWKNQSTEVYQTFEVR